jgi:hypothetical protein
VDWPVAYTNLWDRYIALCNALDAEQERVRVLREALRSVEWEEGSEWNEDSCR